MLGGLFPDDVVTVWGDPLDSARPLFPEEEALVARAVPKRKREFAKGRECARAAMARLGLGLTDIVLLSAESREPLWPMDVVGSITHTDGLCAAAVARSERYRGIGIDAERAEPLAPEVAARVCRGDDLSLLGSSVRSLEKAIVPRLIFSVKEAIYKCLFPITRMFLGFEDVAVVLEEGAFRVTLRIDAPPFQKGTPLRGHWRRTEHHLVTATWLPSAS